MTAEFLWRERSRPTRGPKPALTLDQITDAAIAVADAEGLATVSMQRVAAELGYTKMSLYRYLPGKSELVAAMVERAVGEPPKLAGQGAAGAGEGAAGEGTAAGAGEGCGGWRAALTEWAEQLLRRMAGRAWVLEATAAGGRPVGPNEVAWMEAALTALPAGLTGAERMDAVATLAGHVRMIAGQATTPESEFTAAIGLVLREHADRFPAVAAAVGEAAAEGRADEAFHFGLARFLDGLEAYVWRARPR
nr:TetR/AcrR family transcriptional regulator [uncultured Actinoplanes sp.]